MTAEFTDPVMFVAQGYEYKVQRLWNGEWYNTGTNHFGRDVWYPSLSSGKNALAQHRANRWGVPNTNVYRLIRRPVGEAEVVDG